LYAGASLSGTIGEEAIFATPATFDELADREL